MRPFELEEARQPCPVCARVRVEDDAASKLCVKSCVLSQNTVPTKDRDFTDTTRRLRLVDIWTTQFL
ncbi:hypothetical protein CYMTET_50473 [Cymbomonas tetramitiformis]|uniref:Uncharacterized protein n=1 Tax=Cymbomonas tetramitiformis TaxID=36881 RepID=A0AAE0BMZ0_9CHLO|nr:hypothetical protein CYMTET_50473 [Cymbomonas tetramitiformis]